jgi:mRNA-degrading endonuclease RelE of RelBE toxin-antitoxin system
MRALDTPQFRKSVKRLHRNQKLDLDKAIKEVMNDPDIGQQKVGDLAWLRVFKFRMVNQLVLLAYEVAGSDTIILHDVGSHENFYRDLKAR